MRDQLAKRALPIRSNVMNGQTPVGLRGRVTRSLPCAVWPYRALSVPCTAPVTLALGGQLGRVLLSRSRLTRKTRVLPTRLGG
jgi:hypothetical protein